MSITFELTRHSKMLERYYQIREECFRKDLGLKSFMGREDDHDRNGHIIIIKESGECVGGVRISGVHAGENAILPMEEQGFKLAHYLPELNLESVSYCQWGRLALLPEHRGIDTAKKICRVLLESCQTLGYRFAFNVAGLNRARLYKRLHSYLEYDYHICNHLRLPAEDGFTNLEYLLSVSSIPAVGEQPVSSLASVFCHHKFSTAASDGQLLRVA